MSNIFNAVFIADNEINPDFINKTFNTPPEDLGGNLMVGTLKGI